MNKISTFLCVAAILGGAGVCHADATDNPLLAMVDWEPTTLVDAGDEISIQAYCDGGEAPYVCEWYNQMDEKVGTGDLLQIKADKSQTYRFLVTSADGQVYSAKAHVMVKTPELAMATFEDLPLEAESYWAYDKYADEYLTEDSFISGSYRFGNFPTVAYGSWGGFCYANETANTSTGYMQQYRNAVGGGAANTPNYGMAYMGDPTYPTFTFDTNIHLATDEAGAVVPGMYVTNSAWTVNSIVNGDGFSPKFTADHADYMTLKITGYNAAGDPTGTIELPLADFRNLPEGSTDGYVLTNWKWVDLSSLGAISRFELRYDSSRLSTVPSYVCIDQVGASDPGASVEKVLSTVSLTMPAENCLSVLGVEGSYTLAIYSADGVMRDMHSLYGANTVSIASLTPGVYIAEVVAENGARQTLRFVKR